MKSVAAHSLTSSTSAPESNREKTISGETHIRCKTRKSHVISAGPRTAIEAICRETGGGEKI